MDKLTKTKVILFITFLSAIALAAGVAERFPTDQIRFGKSGSTDDREVIFDTGDGASNPKLSVDTTDKDFEFSKSLSTKGNTLTLGDGAGSDKTFLFDVGLGANNPNFKWDNAESALSFANDGITFKKIGAGGGGGGGGINFLGELNPDFESADPPQNYLASLGGFTAELVNPVFLKQSGRWDASTLAETLRSQTITINAASGFLGAVGQRCQAELYYKYPLGANGDIALEILDQTNAVILELPLATTLGDESEIANVSFPCPADGDSVLMGLISKVADPEVILFDNWFLGTGKNTISVSQGELIAEAHYPPSGGCTWGRNGINHAPFSAAAGCVPIVQTAGTGVVDTTEDDLPNITIKDAKPGIYTVHMSGMIFLSGGLVAHTAGLAMYDSVTAAVGPACYGHSYEQTSGANNLNAATCTKTITVPTTQDITFEIYGNENNTGTINLQNVNSLYGQTTFTVTKAPLKSAEGLTFLTSGEYWDLSVGGANIDLNGGANFGGLTAMENGGLDMVVNPGSKAAKIPCSGTNPATGLVCGAGLEQIGATIETATAGRFKICASFVHRLDVNGASGSQETQFRWVQTENASQTITQISPGNIGNSLIVASSLSGRVFSGYPVLSCGNFTFNSAGTQTLRLMREQSVSGTTPNTSFIFADRSVALTERDINITVEKLDQQIPAPVFPEITGPLNKRVKTNVGNFKACVFSGGSTGSAAVDDQTDCVFSVATAGGATLNVTWEAGTWADDQYSCQCTVTANDLADAFCVTGSPLVGSMSFKTYDSGVAENEAFRMTCTGLSGN